MEIISRAESGLSPPRATPTGPYEKNVIIVHYTASPNGILNPGEERSLMRMWQVEHENKYGAWDILQAYSCFQSGRVYENRLWTSNSGAIYNSAGGTVFGWSTKGVGIENQGMFTGAVVMGEPQYSALVALCADIYKRPGFRPLQGRWIFGHRELPPCRPSDPWGKGTDCPANLLGQFLTNGKLQNDVLAYHGAPIEPKEDEMYIAPQLLPKQGDLFVWHIPEGVVALDWLEWARTWLYVTNEGTEPVELQVFVTPGGEVTNNGKRFVVLGWSRLDIPIGDLAKNLGVKNGFTTVIKAKSDNLSLGISVWNKLK